MKNLSNKNYPICLFGTFLFLLFFQINGFSQEHIVHGTVIDESGEPLIGVNILDSLSGLGTATDFDGYYELSGLDEETVLYFSYVGYESTKVPVNKRSEINVTLKSDAQTLTEIVVTGYGGKQMRSKVTSSISKVGEEALTVGVFSNPAQALSGAVAGLRVIQTSGNPGATPSIVLRGGTNFDGSGSPLVMVDGQLRDGLHDINPENIESIEVLKDAGATALYGARASNGVILVTTKRGRDGHREINFKAKTGLNYLNNPYTFLGAEDYIRVQRKAYVETPWAPVNNLNGAAPMGIGNVYDSRMAWNLMELSDDNRFLLDQGWNSMVDPIDPDRTLIYKETDIERFSFNNPSVTQDYNINMSGGNDKGSYYAGGGYNHSEGLPITSYYKRYNFIFNGDYKVADWLTSTSSFNFDRANWKSMPGSQTSEANYFGRLQSVPPTARWEDEEGNLLLGVNAGDGNQLYQADKFTTDFQTDKFTIIQGLEMDFLKHFTLRGSAQWFYSEGINEAFTKDFETVPGSFNRTRSSSASFARDFSQTYNATLSYGRSEEHTSELQSRGHLVCRLLREKKKKGHQVHTVWTRRVCAGRQESGTLGQQGPARARWQAHATGAAPATADRSGVAMRAPGSR